MFYNSRHVSWLTEFLDARAEPRFHIPFGPVQLSVATRKKRSSRQYLNKTLLQPKHLLLDTEPKFGSLLPLEVISKAFLEVGLKLTVVLVARGLFVLHKLQKPAFVVL